MRPDVESAGIAWKKKKNVVNILKILDHESQLKSLYCSKGLAAEAWRPAAAALLAAAAKAGRQDQNLRQELHPGEILQQNPDDA